MKLTGKNYLKINPNDEMKGAKGISQKELERFFITYLAKKYGEDKIGLTLILDEGTMFINLQSVEEDVLNKLLLDYEKKIKKYTDLEPDDFLYGEELGECLAQLLLEEYFERNIEEIIEERSYDFESCFYVIFE